MIENIDLPEEVLINVGTESKEFAVRSRLNQPVRSSLSRVFFGLFWLGFTGFIMFMFLSPILSGGDSTVKINGKDTVVSLHNLKPVIPLLIFFSIFVVVGFIMLIPGLISLFRKGGYFVGTPLRLVWYRKGVLKSMDWSQFTGSIELRGTNKRGSITMEMTSGRNVSRKGGSRYVPDMVYMIGIPSAFEIEQIVRRRIEEHTSAKS